MTTCRNCLVFGIMLLGTLGGVASIVLICLGETKIGGIMTLSLIPAVIGCLEWRCRETSRTTRGYGSSRLKARGAERNPPHRNKGSLRDLSSQTGNPKGGNTSLAVAEALPTSDEVRINIAPDSPGSK
jgi:hypothetical protein